LLGICRRYSAVNSAMVSRSKRECLHRSSRRVNGSEPSVQFGLEFSDAQAQKYHRGFSQAYPNLRKWHRPAREQASEITYGATEFGRRRWANPEDRADQWEWNRFQLAANFEVQGSGVDALKIALVKLGRYLTDNTRVVLPILDATLIQCSRDEADAVAECTRATNGRRFLSDPWKRLSRNC
jgi:DNA polymerase I-like protein with 3'-5' exonuclease and polymerase domains